MTKFCPKKAFLSGLVVGYQIELREPLRVIFCSAYLFVSRAAVSKKSSFIIRYKYLSKSSSRGKVSSGPTYSVSGAMSTGWRSEDQKSSLFVSVCWLSASIDDSVFCVSSLLSVSDKNSCSLNSWSSEPLDKASLSSSDELLCQIWKSRACTMFTL